MLNYIKSEIYRAFRTPLYRGFLIFSLVAIIITVVVTGVFYENFQDYFNVMKAYSTLGILMISSISAILAYKTKDTKVQILSYGVKRKQMYFWDIISMQLISLITTIILGILAIVSGFVVEGFGSMDTYLNFLKYLGFMIFLNINLNNAIMGLIYFTNNTSLGIVGQYIIIPLITMMLSLFTVETKAEYFFQKLKMIQPYAVLQGYAAVPSLTPYMNIIVTSFAFVLAIYVTTGYLAFKKREIY